MVAFGGNALLSRGEPLTMDAQWQNATKVGAECPASLSQLSALLGKAPSNFMNSAKNPSSPVRASLEAFQGLV